MDYKETVYDLNTLYGSAVNVFYNENLPNPEESVMTPREFMSYSYEKPDFNTVSFKSDVDKNKVLLDRLYEEQKYF